MRTQHTYKAGTIGFIILIVLSFFTLFGCAKQTEAYMLKVYEKVPAEYSLEDQTRIKEMKQLFDTIIKESDKQTLEDFEKPKGFSYEITNDKQTIYELIGGYLIYQNLVYQVVDYENTIVQLKGLFDAS